MALSSPNITISEFPATDEPQAVGKFCCIPVCLKLNDFYEGENVLGNFTLQVNGLPSNIPTDGETITILGQTFTIGTDTSTNEIDLNNASTVSEFIIEIYRALCANKDIICKYDLEVNDTATPATITGTQFEPCPISLDDFDFAGMSNIVPVITTGSTQSNTYDYYQVSYKLFEKIDGKRKPVKTNLPPTVVSESPLKLDLAKLLQGFVECCIQHGNTQPSKSVRELCLSITDSVSAGECGANERYTLITNNFTIIPGNYPEKDTIKTQSIQPIDNRADWITSNYISAWCDDVPVVRSLYLSPTLVNAIASQDRTFIQYKVTDSTGTVTLTEIPFDVSSGGNFYDIQTGLEQLNPVPLDVISWQICFIWRTDTQSYQSPALTYNAVKDKCNSVCVQYCNRHGFPDVWHACYAVAGSIKVDSITTCLTELCEPRSYKESINEVCTECTLWFETCNNKQDDRLLDFLSSDLRKAYINGSWCDASLSTKDVEYFSLLDRGATTIELTFKIQ